MGGDAGDGERVWRALYVQVFTSINNCTMGDQSSTNPTVQQLERELEENPSNVRALSELAQILAYRGDYSGACQNYEIITGSNNVKNEWELLLTPVTEKVNQCNTNIGSLPAACGGVFDPLTRKVFTLEFTGWAWNMSLDLKDRFAQLRWRVVHLK